MRDARAMAEVALARVVRRTDGGEMGALQQARDAVVHGGKEEGAGADTALATDTMHEAQRSGTAQGLHTARSGGERRRKRVRATEEAETSAGNTAAR